MSASIHMHVWRKAGIKAILYKNQGKHLYQEEEEGGGGGGGEDDDDDDKEDGKSGFLQFHVCLHCSKTISYIRESVDSPM